MATLADVIREHGPAYLARFGDRVPARHRAAMQAVLACRTGALGGHLYRCRRCQQRHVQPHSCGHRACPRCGMAQTERFIARQRELLLPVPYFHVVFTVPAELRRLVRAHQRIMLGAIARCAVDAIAALCRDPRHLGAERIGALAVLHTWSRTLVWHPHVHLLVCGVGLDDGQCIVRPRRADYLLPAHPLANAFRNRLLAAIRSSLPNTTLDEGLASRRWVVHLQATLGGHTDALLAYLGRYVHRTALSDKRIISVERDAVVFSYRESATQQRKLMRLHPHEFLRRTLQHVPPKGMHRVRAYGLWHRSARSTLRAMQLRLAASSTPSPTESSSRTTRVAAPRCPSCGHDDLQWLCRLDAAALARVTVPIARPTARAPPPPRDRGRAPSPPVLS